MNILVLTDQDRWFCDGIDLFKNEIENVSGVNLVTIGYDHTQYIDSTYDYCFLLGYSRIIKQKFLDLFKNIFVVHASDLPQGKGMSPLSWQILEGKTEVIFTLFQAVEALDAGDIYLQRTLTLSGFELVGEIRDLQRKMTSELVLTYLREHSDITPRKQLGEGFRYPLRTAKDSQLEITKSIDEQFNLLRICDNELYPSFFVKDGVKYILKIYRECDA